MDSKLIANAAALVGQSAIGFDLSTQAPFIEWIQYSKQEFEAMKTKDVALFYVALSENSNILPNNLKPRVIQANFSKTEQERGTENYIINSEIEAARTELAKIKKGTVEPKFLSVDQAVQMLQTSTP